MQDTEIAIIGAGPHGLSAAAHLQRAGAEVTVFGDPMSFWRTMPAGMLLRSNWTATSIAEYDGPLSLDGYRKETGVSLRTPVPLQHFIDYGMWVQRSVVPGVDRRTVVSVHKAEGGFVLSLDDGSRMAARRLVVAAGIAAFVNRPSLADRLPAELASHTADHTDLAGFAGLRVLVVGGGQSALESAALMHEAGADVEVVVRSDHLNWLHGGIYHRRLGRLAPLVYAPTDVGPMGISRIVAKPGLFKKFPQWVQDPMAARAIRPAGAAWLRTRLADVPLHLNRAVTAATPHAGRLRVVTDGRTQVVDHLMFGTGYRVDLGRYPFLDPALTARIRTVRGYPALSRGMESSVPGLHFLGAPAAHSFGPIMRFVAGGWFGARTLTEVAVPHRRGAVGQLSADPRTSEP